MVDKKEHIHMTTSVRHKQRCNFSKSIGGGGNRWKVVLEVPSKSQSNPISLHIWSFSSHSIGGGGLGPSLGCSTAQPNIGGAGTLPKRCKVTPLGTSEQDTKNIVIIKYHIGDFLQLGKKIGRSILWGRYLCFLQDTVPVQSATRLLYSQLALLLGVDQS